MDSSHSDPNGSPEGPSSGRPSSGHQLDLEALEARGRARQRLRRRIGALGCGCFLVLAVVGLWLGWAVYRGAQNLAADLADPEARTQKVLDELGAESLPEGYYAAMTVDVPLPFDMVILSDEPWELEESESEDAPAVPMFNGVPGSKLFYYIHILAADRSGQDPFEREFNSDRKLGQGDLKIHERLVAWEAHAGRVLRPQGREPGVFARLRIDCEDEETRRAVWFHRRDGIPEEPSQEELAGTPADPQAIAEFLGHFRLCGVDEEPAAESDTESTEATEVMEEAP